VCGKHVHLRGHAAGENWKISTFRTATKFDGDELERRIDGLHSGDERVVHSSVLGSVHVVDAWFVVDSPPLNRLVAGRNMEPVRSAEASRVVVTDQILGIAGELLKRGIKKIVLRVVHGSRRHRNLELGAVVTDGEHRLRDRIHNCEIPSGRAGLRHALRYSLKANVVRSKVVQWGRSAGEIREELIVPLGWLKRGCHGQVEWA
jgi:hypothetical protein